VNQDRAGAATDVRRIVRRVLTDRGLDKEVIRIGLDSPVDTRGADLAPSEVAAVDVARCLVRKPDVLIVERALDGLPDAKASVARLRRALVGRGLILVIPELSQAMDTPLFDAVLRFDRGSATVEDRRKYTAVEPAPEPVASV
jgi:ABC-type multidrug transport system fused ATPase/permease subunit